MTPEGAIRLTLPADADLAPVVSSAVRAVARQVALPQAEIDRLRAAVVAALEARAASHPHEAVELVLRPAHGSLGITLADAPVG